MTRSEINPRQYYSQGSIAREIMMLITQTTNACACLLSQIRAGDKVYRNDNNISKRYTVTKLCPQYAVTFKDGIKTTVINPTIIAKSDIYADEIVITEKDFAEENITLFPVYRCTDYYIPDLADFSLN